MWSIFWSFIWRGGNYKKLHYLKYLGCFWYAGLKVQQEYELLLLVISNFCNEIVISIHLFDCCIQIESLWWTIAFEGTHHLWFKIMQKQFYVPCKSPRMWKLEWIYGWNSAYVWLHLPFSSTKQQKFRRFQV